jgi:hypothetical protein
MSVQILGMSIATELIAVVVLAFTAGLTVPFRYGVERMRGFGRAVVSRLPYKPPSDPTGRVDGDRSEESEPADRE